MLTSKKERKSLQARVPKISTRGYYDLATGKTLKKKDYDLYPRKFFESLGSFSEFVIVVHGMRNDKAGALAKFAMAEKRLGDIGYEFPVVGYSYDANVKNAHVKSKERDAINAARVIAKKNGSNLAKFILQFKRRAPGTQIRLIGHSLGTEVILHSLYKLRGKVGIIRSVHFFGSSVPVGSFHPKNFGKEQNVVSGKILNYYSGSDDVLKEGYRRNLTEKPIGYLGEGRSVRKFAQKKVRPKNHRFVSYLAVLKAFP